MTHSDGNYPDVSCSPDNSELLPCPFCGGAASYRGDGFPLIFCEGADCFGPATTAENFDDAAVQWNRRDFRPLWRLAGVAQTMPRHTALELLARADKYLNTGSNEYASEILRDMTEFVRKSIIRKELRNADLPKHPMTPHSPDDPSLSSTLCGEK